MDPVKVFRADGPLVLAFPHTGTFVPPEIEAKLNAEGKLLRDTDWHIERLYAGLIPDATTVQATFHRYVIDANRDPSGQSLYPGQTTTGLVPLSTFDNTPIWDHEPTEAEIAERLTTYHAPYHAALRAELDRVKKIHGFAVLYDCHSIRSVIPWLFDGVLPELNIGTNHGATCDKAIEAACFDRSAATGRTHVLNGRFVGGWTTRHYGQPQDNVHAIQMELSQASHLSQEEPPFDLDPTLSAKLRPQLADILSAIIGAAKGLAH